MTFTGIKSHGKSNDGEAYVSQGEWKQVTRKLICHCSVCTHSGRVILLQ